MDKVRLCLSYSFDPRNGGPQWKDSQICMFSRMATENYIHFVSPMLFENFTFVLYYNNLPPLFPLIIPLFHLKFTISSHYYCFTHIHTQSSGSMWYCFVCRYVFRGDHLVWIAYMGAHIWRRQIFLPLEICSSSSGVFFSWSFLQPPGIAIVWTLLSQLCCWDFGNATLDISGRQSHSRYPGLLTL